jgi:hypothetical protein
MGVLVKDEYAYLRGQYLEIIEHCEYLLQNSADPVVLSRANETKQCAMDKLARMNLTAPSKGFGIRYRTNG